VKGAIIASAVATLMSMAAVRAGAEPLRPLVVGLPPHEIVAILRAAGFAPLVRPARGAGVFFVRALDPDDRLVRVTVEARYLEEHSSPADDRYAFAYVVTIANEGQSRVQLRRRHWIITDGNGKVEEVEGPGVVGQQPILEQGDVHRYTSGCVLPTPVGTMEGTYEMHAAGGRVFQAEIPRFPLRMPNALH